MSIPVVIKGHPSRVDWIMELKESYFPYAHISMDHGMGLIGNSLRQYEMVKDYALEEGSEWGFVMDDDMYPADGVGKYIDDLAEILPEDAAIASLWSLYSARGMDGQSKIENGEYGYYERVKHNNFSQSNCTFLRVEVIDMVLDSLSDALSNLKRGDREKGDKKQDCVVYQSVINGTDWKEYTYIPWLFYHREGVSLRDGLKKHEWDSLFVEDGIGEYISNSKVYDDTKSN